MTTWRGPACDTTWRTEQVQRLVVMTGLFADGAAPAGQLINFSLGIPAGVLATAALAEAALRLEAKHRLKEFRS